MNSCSLIELSSTDMDCSVEVVLHYLLGLAGSKEQSYLARKLNIAVDIAMNGSMFATVELRFTKGLS